MQSAAELARACVSKSKSRIEKSAPSSVARPCASSIDPLLPRPAVMRQLWGRMAAMYGGARWASATSALPQDKSGQLTMAAATWQQALRGISETQIAEGLRACLASNDQYVPTAMEFRARCLGVPAIEEVQWALRMRSVAKPSAFVRLVWSFMDAHGLARAGQQKAERIVLDAYKLARVHVMRGGELPPEPAGEIEAPKPAPRRKAKRATVDAAMRELSKSLGLEA